MAGRNDELWLQNFELYKDYVEKHHKLPPTNSTFEYKGIKLGLWVANQASMHKSGIMPKVRFQILHSFNSFWNGTKEEKEQENRRLLLDSDWKKEVLKGCVPIDTYYSKKEDLYICLSHGIIDLEKLIDCRKEYSSIIHKLSHYDIDECYSKVLPLFDPYYTRVLSEIMGYRLDETPIEVIKTNLGQFCFNSPEDIESKFNQVMSVLNDREVKVLSLLYKEKMTLEQVGSIFGLSKERIHSIKNEALRKMRHPYCMDLLRKTGTELDRIPISSTVRNLLYSYGMRSISDFLLLSKDSEQASSIYHIDTLAKIEIQSLSEQLIELSFDNLRESVRLYGIWRDFISLSNKNINDLGLSVRSCNRMRNSGILTLREFYEVSQDKELLKQIPNLGQKSFIEIQSKAKEIESLYYECITKESYLKSANLDLGETFWKADCNKEIHTMLDFYELIYGKHQLLVCFRESINQDSKEVFFQAKELPRVFNSLVSVLEQHSDFDIYDVLKVLEKDKSEKSEKQNKEEVRKPSLLELMCNAENRVKNDSLISHTRSQLVFEQGL